MGIRAVVLVAACVAAASAACLFEPDAGGSLAIPGTLTTIPPSAFAPCNTLTSVSIPASVTLIDTNAFRGSAALEVVGIPNSVTVIGEFSCSILTVHVTTAPH